MSDLASYHEAVDALRATLGTAERERTWLEARVTYLTNELKIVIAPQPVREGVLRHRAETAERERDEARAEVEKLQEDVETLTERLEAERRKPSPDFALACWQAQAKRAEAEVETLRAELEQIEACANAAILMKARRPLDELEAIAHWACAALTKGD